MPFPMPERLHTESGALRRVGVELEFAGLELPRISAVLHDCFGGRIVEDSAFVHRVEDTRWGTFVVELDASLLKERIYADYLRRIGIDLPADASRDRLEDFLARAASTVVPMEVVTPPIPLPDLHKMEELRGRLLREDAMGTRASWLYAFGLHLNPELAVLNADEALRHLRAFLLLHDWLHVAGEIDWTRRIMPYIDPFPDSYRRRVIDPSYAPDLEQLVADYLRDNPTRNRSLDMLPLFRELLGDRAVAPLGDAAHLVKPRPAFHYRLPNCRIDEPDWTLAHEYGGWVAVEWLAQRPECMADLADRFREHQPPWHGGIDKEWAAICDEVLP